MNPVQRALWFVESHSREPISLDAIARACKVSAFHLTRAFAETTGMSLMRYVRGRRLTEAARQLADGADDILRLALDSGYGSHEAFTRAFREQFGLTPERIREQGHLDRIPLVEPIPMTTQTLPDVTPDRFEVREPMLLAGLVERHPCQSPQGIPAQWQRLGPFFRRLPQVGSTAYGVVYNVDADENFDYLAGVEVASTDALPDGVQTLQTKRQKYVVFKHTGHIAGIRSTFAAIWNKWLPESGYRAAEAPVFECYGPEFNPQTGLGGFEVCIPIQE